ncbi:MAG TPA: hypothetical protein VLL75_16160 [Vicinamibacteria bacterium]|nr:hypothetical protein [Vicinamibacteria bacterium]
MVSFEGLGRYDSLYLSPREGDALVSCAARLHSDLGKGLSALVVSIFDGPAFRSGRIPVPAPAGVVVHSLGLSPAARRHPRHAAFSSSRFATLEDDAVVRDQLARTFEDLKNHVRPRQVFAPLGAGGHVDHRIVGEAATTTFGGEVGRNVFLYEDRPEALVPGEVRLRLSLLGARLPAGASDAAERSTFLRHLRHHRRGAALRGEGGSPLDGLRSVRPAAARWREASGWNPQKAFGPRLQPVLQVADAAAVAHVLQAAVSALPEKRGVRSRFARHAAAYTRRLGAAGYAERYWLLLPRLDGAHEPTAEENLF